MIGGPQKRGPQTTWTRDRMGFVQVSARLAPEEADAVDEHADMLGISRSEFVRRALAKAVGMHPTGGGE